MAAAEGVGGHAGMQVEHDGVKRPSEQLARPRMGERPTFHDARRLELGYELRGSLQRGLAFSVEHDATAVWSLVGAEKNTALAPF
jgi:hypothetical protein